jgi:crotonobetainyl-CoA:carnitine CoA-transferase CaiB-like acyl-CoA transferase
MLSHVKVLDLSNTLPGPYCTMLLAHYGAQVIKVERPDGGDIMREIDPWLFENLNQNKQSIVLNLKDTEDRNVIYRLVQDIDVVIEGFRPGVVKRLGVDYETLKEINPRLIYCSISGYGQTGAYRDVPSHDLNCMGMAGALSMTGRIEEDPEEGHVQHIPYSDYAAGLFAAFSIMASLNQPNQEGNYIDVSMADIMFTWMGMKAGFFFNEGKLANPSELREAHYGVFKTKDDRYVVLGIIEDHFWIKLCEYFDWKDYLDNKEFSQYKVRNQHSDTILPRLRKTIANYEMRPLVEDLLQLGVPCTPIQNLDELLDDPHFNERKLLLPTGSNRQQYIGFPIKMSNNPNLVSNNEYTKNSAPKLGEHTREIVQKFKCDRG